MNQLMNYVGERKRFVAKYDRLGKKRIYDGIVVDTILVTKIIDVDTGIELKDHSWIEYAPEIKKVKFSKGDWLCFDATVGTYIKGILYKTNKTRNKAQMMLDANLFGFQNVRVIHN